MDWRWAIRAVLFFVLIHQLFGLTAQAEISSAEEAAKTKFARVTIKLGSKKLNVELADTEDLRNQGLMFRRELAQDAGMLFVFRHEQVLSFWMKNTFIPLSIGFFNKEKVLIDIHEMEPVKSVLESPKKSYTSKGPAQYALEMNRGWFAKNKIDLGTTLEILK